MMSRRNNIYSGIDWLTIFIWVLLVLFGLINIYSANIMSGEGTLFDFSSRHGKQLIWIGISFLIIIIIFILDHKFYSFFAYLLYGIIIAILIFVLLFGREVNGARSWFSLGGFLFQPSEFAKPLTALALAQLISSHGFNIKKFRYLALSGILFLAPAILIMLQPDLGSTLVYFAFIFVLYREGFSQNTMILGASLVVLFILTLLLDKIILVGIILAISLLLFMILSGYVKKTIILLIAGGSAFGLLYLANYLLGERYSYFAISIAGTMLLISTLFIYSIRKRQTNYYKILVGTTVAVLFIVSVDLAMNNLLKEHQKQRIYVTLGLKDDPQGVGYNVNQSKIAIGSGGFSGKGFLQGTQTKLQFVPEQSTDFIFCTVGEEWGFLGTSIVVLLFVLLIIRLIILAERQKSHFSRVFGYGLVAIILAHFVVNIGMTIGIMPVIGIPLPFFSYGGSSLIAFTMFLFIFLKLDSNRIDQFR